MSKAFKDLNSLFNYLEKEVRKSIQREDSNTAKYVKEVAKENVQRHVYDVYQPIEYVRQNLLKENWEVKPTKDGIEVISDRYDKRDGKSIYVSEVVHTGIGYNPNWPFPYQDVPRPFADEAAKELKTNKNKDLQGAVKRDIQRNGLNVG